MKSDEVLRRVLSCPNVTFLATGGKHLVISPLIEKPDQDHVRTPPNHIPVLEAWRGADRRGEERGQPSEVTNNLGAVLMGEP